MRNLINFFRLMFFMPSIIMAGIYVAIVTYRMYKRGELDVRDKVDLYRNYTYLFEEKRAYFIHISSIFCILFFYLITT